MTFKAPKPPLVSIIMPMYNVEDHIAAAIQSVIDQTFCNWELIVINDASTDNSLSIAKKYTSEKVRVYSKKNEGAAAARNFGFRQSVGTFIKFLDSDDLINQKMIESQVNLAMENPGLIISGKWGRFYQNDLETFKLSPEECWKNMNSIDWICSSWENGKSMTQPGIFLIPRILIDQIGLWNESLSLIDDLEFYTKIILGSKGVVFSESSILYYRSGNPNNLSGQKSRKAYESAFLSIRSGAEQLLNSENSERVKKICADNLRRWQYEFYPNHIDLYNKTKSHVKQLGGSNFPFPAGGYTKLLCALLGWKITKIIKLIFIKRDQILDEKRT